MFTMKVEGREIERKKGEVVIKWMERRILMLYVTYVFRNVRQLHVTVEYTIYTTLGSLCLQVKYAEDANTCS